MTLRLLVVCPHFAPDSAPTGIVMTRLVSELAALGNEVDVVTSLPWYRQHRVEPDWRGRPIRTANTDWGSITRIHPMASADKSDVVRRAISFGGFSLAAAAVGAAKRRKPYDGVLAMSPPITLFLAGRVAGVGRNVPVVANIQDVFPDVAIELGVIRGPRAISFFRRLEKMTYRVSDAVTVLSEDLRAAVAPRVSEPSKVRVIPNFVDTDAVRPTDASRYRAELGVEGRTTVMYAGNIGFSQPFEMLIETARLLASRPDIVLVINGQGAARESVEAMAAGAPNVVFGDFQPAGRLSEVLSAGDMHVVPLKPGLASASVPSKSYSILAAARPLISSVDVGTEIERIVERSGAGVSVAPNNASHLAEAVVRLADDPQGRAEMGRRGREFVETWASPAAVARMYHELFIELTEARSNRA